VEGDGEGEGREGLGLCLLSVDGSGLEWGA